MPLNDTPQDMNIPHDGYPVADENGHYEYEIDIPLEKLQAKFKDDFGTEDLQLDKRVVYVHGVPKDLELPDYGFEVKKISLKNKTVKFHQL